MTKHTNISTHTNKIYPSTLNLKQTNHSKTPKKNDLTENSKHPSQYTTTTVFRPELGHVIGETVPGGGWGALFT